jgi:penicillin-binding protein
MASCEKTPAPEQRLADYVKLWNEQKFSQMYRDFLSSSSKKTYKIENYVDRYKTIYKDLDVKHLKVTALPSKKKEDWNDPDRAELPIDVKMDTAAGPIHFKKNVHLKLEEKDGKKNWYIDWNTTYIFPELKEGDKVRLETIEGKRGEIFDRNGNSLAINSKGYEVGIIPKQFGHDRQKKTQLAQLLGVSVAYIDKQLNQSWVKPDYFVPLKELLADDPKFNEVMSIPGVQANEKLIREYPYHESLAHLTGYVGTITKEELAEEKKKGYKEGDWIGKRGLEKLLEDKLRATNGKKIVIEKTNGHPVVLAETKAKDGESVKLTIDAELQKVIYNEMNGQPGTAAAIDPKTGKVLALVSSPGFDPNEFITGISADRYQQLADDPSKPLLNRFASTYAPGSTIKPITAAIGLKTGKLNPNKARNIKGLKWQKDPSWGNYHVTRVTDPGKPVNLETALVNSDNIYFAQTALEIGKQDMEKGLKQFGFESKLPFAYPIRSSQISNSGHFDKERLLSDSGYGQGELLVSMLHLASMYGGIVHQGIMMRPILFSDEKPQVWKKELLSKKDAALLQKDLRLIVEKGTAKKANHPSLKLAGKTGTAELKSNLGESGKENGLFVAYDQNKPNMVLAILMEGVNSRGGSSSVVQLSKNIFLQWEQMNPL